MINRARIIEFSARVYNISLLSSTESSKEAWPSAIIGQSLYHILISCRARNITPAEGLIYSKIARI